MMRITFLKKTTINNYKLIESHLEKIKLPTTLKLLNARKNWKSKNLFNNMLSDKKKIGTDIKPQPTQSPDNNPD